MAKYELKTKKNTQSVSAFLNSIEDPKKRKQAKELNKIFKEVTKEKPKMWGSSIIGYGEYTYTNSAKKDFTWMATAFSPRKQNLTLYVMPGFSQVQEDLKKLGPYKTGKSCLYIKDLNEIHMPTLKKIIRYGYKKIVGKHNPVIGN